MRTDGTIAILAILSLLAFPALATEDAKQTSPTPHPKAVFSELEYSFGEVEPGTPLEHRFEFKNEGTADLRILRVKAACGCTSSAFDSLVAPGKTGGITLAVKHTASYKGDVAKIATVTTDDPEQASLRLTLKAKFPAG